ncbi:MAG: nucleoside recognition domain-containing protein [Butyricicoccus sp.]|nr:nucleoside recognition domain-containing protein [Butyricicoccus sp.]
MRKPSNLAALLAGALFLALIPCASAAAQGADEGLSIALGTAVPALFPFFVVSGLMVSTGACAALGRLLSPLMWRLYSLPGAAAGPLVLGLTGGYPVGARAACGLYRRGELTRDEAERLLGFCNNTGPAFIVGVCGAGLRGSVRDGVLLYLIHIASALLTGLAMTRSPDKGVRPPVHRARDGAQPDLSACLVDAVESAGRSCLKITAFIMLFSMLRRVLLDTGLLSMLSVLTRPLSMLTGAPASAEPALLTGLLEMTSGLVLLPECAGRAVLPCMSLLLGLGGLSILCQTLSVTAEHGLSLRRMVCGKLLHGLIAAVLTVLWQSAAPRSAPVSAPSALPVLCPPAVSAGLLLLSVLFTICTGKRRRDTV